MGIVSIDPPGPDGRIGGHYFHTWCPSVTKKTKLRYSAKTKHTTTLHRAWWVTLKSPDLFYSSFNNSMVI